MNLSLNPQVDISEATPIVFGGVEFKVAPLMFRQTVRIGPKIPDVCEIMNRRQEAIDELVLDAEGRTTFADNQAYTDYLRKVSLSEAESQILISVVHVGLTRVYPALTLDDLMDLPASANDLFGAAAAIIVASKATQKKSAASPGE